MGEVYEAEDTRLKRRVAIKILPAGIATDPSRLARFEHEAQALASLNHPNIVTLHSVEEDGDCRFLTMEAVEGQTIERLIPPGGMPLGELLTFAIPIVDAVAAAHARGIIHRDLKPANIMVSDDRRVKVLDFGLAKLVETRDALNAETATAPLPLSMAGQIVGTAAYMSPEQAEGSPIDQRSDIFSLGILLYEMASGAPPFRGDSNLRILASIVRDEPPPLARVCPRLPAALSSLVAACLSKDPAQRPSADALKDQLAALLAPAAGTKPATRRRTAFAIVTAAAALMAVVVVVTRTLQKPAPARTPTFTRVTYGSGVEASPTVSPDGRTVVYVALQPNGRQHLYASPLNGGGSARDLTGADSPAADDAPAFSPDGRSIAFASSHDGSDGLFVMSSSGGDVRRIVNGGYDPSWTPDGKTLLYSTESGQDPDGREAPSQVWAVDLTTGQRRLIAKADAVDPRVSPDGRFAAFWALPVDDSGAQFSGANRDVWLQPIAGGDRVRITDSESSDWNPAWSPDGRFLYFSSDRGGTMNIWRVEIDGRSGAPRGPAVAITAPSAYVAEMSFGADGTMAYASVDYDTAVRAIAFDASNGAVTGATRDIVTGHRSWLQPDVSPDAQLLTLRSFRSQEDVWVVRTDGSGLRPVTNDPARDRGSRFAPDGSLMFYSSRSGTYQFWSIHSDGSGAQQLTHGDWALNYPLPSPDGRWVAGTNPNTNEQYIFDRQDWTKAPERLPAPPVKGQMYLRDWSPDGTRFAAADTSNGLWVFDRGGQTWTRVGNGAYPRWLPDGRRMLAVLKGRIVLVDTDAKTTTDVFGETGRYIGSLAIAPGGRLIYFTSAVTRANIWTMRVR